MNSIAHADGDNVRTHAVQKYMQTVLSKFFMLLSGFKSDLCAFSPPAPDTQIFNIISEDTAYNVPSIYSNLKSKFVHV